MGTKKRAPRVPRSYYASVFVLTAFFLILGLALVWLNIERTDLAYRIERIEDELGAKRELVSKLEVERNNLLAPQELRRTAEKFQLAPARPGQVRRVKFAK